jgi:predicted nucleic acid-binding protein
MNRYVVDASVAVKWFVPEILSEFAIQLLQPDNVLLAPDLLMPEICNTLWKKVGRGELDLDDALQCLTDLNLMPLQLYASPELVHDALRVSTREKIPAYDSLYLALASLLDCRMVTADARLRNSIRDQTLKDRVLLLESSGFPA